MAGGRRAARRRGEAPHAEQRPRGEVVLPDVGGEARADRVAIVGRAHQRGHARRRQARGLHAGRRCLCGLRSTIRLETRTCGARRRGGKGGGGEKWCEGARGGGRGGRRGRGGAGGRRRRRRAAAAPEGGGGGGGGAPASTSSQSRAAAPSQAEERVAVFARVHRAGRARDRWRAFRRARGRPSRPLRSAGASCAAAPRERADALARRLLRCCG